ncbi:hypothetical protein [Aquiflexum gelatinilyticum]|uniref:Outer membrane protein beta-barrel domain-containing protein n=1 Tax=Aquiflexum gelatinilyticum TaxID=2961943 RepID=A0A9X2P5D6_9BACT|nr:hypothetical protein [Aquiflexum gelatinilyticum]MCR9013857.1 hypothetical protein [Aquiflexum gelatinilyticum]
MKTQLILITSILVFFGFVSKSLSQSTTSNSGGIPIKKGMWFSSLSLSASSKQAENERQLFATYLNESRSSFLIRLDPGYVIKDNLGIGLGLLYGSTEDISTQQASDGVISDVKLAERRMAFRPYIKNFIPLGTSNRFYIIIPTELQIGYGSQLKEVTTNQVLTRTHSNTIYYGLEMRPGMLVFVHKNFGFEVNVGAFGISNSVSRGTATNLPDSKVVNNDLSLKINLLELALGFSIYL